MAIEETLKEAVQHHTAGRLAEAHDLYQEILGSVPEHPDALHLLGVIASQSGDHEAAITLIGRAVGHKPDFAAAHNNLGAAFQDLGRIDDAIASYRQAIVCKPDFAEAHNNLGHELTASGHFEDAVASCRTALACKPDYADAHNNLGAALLELGRLDDAISHFQAAIAVRPDFAEAHLNLGIADKQLGLLDAAIASFRRALKLRPGYGVAERYLTYALLNVPGLPPQYLFEEHLRLTRNHVPDDTTPPPANDADPERRLRIGYLSSDFRNHPVGHNMLGLMHAHDRDRFEIFCYGDVPSPDAMTAQLRGLADHWRDIVRKPDSAVADMARADGIDILVSLAGRFDRNRPQVCARRVAPVQVSLFDGATSGLREMDYWITDDFLNPADTAEIFTEHLCHLPVLYQHPEIADSPPLGPPPAERNGFISFGSFNNPAKINPDVIALWAKVLQSVAGSRLLLKSRELYDQPSLRRRMLDGFAAAGIAEDRLTLLASHDTLSEHLKHYDDVDIALDPFPFTGATTTFEALWMGVPVITLTGDTFIQRMSGSILRHLGLVDLIVETPDAYVARATALAADLPRLKNLRAGLRDRIIASPLSDAPAYARSIEAAYRDMWRTWCAGKA
ncbi:MAG: O-linked N-acetylglucosamine transferase, SPINDLY family protein [Alphaproteobacteria bacterium]